MLYRDNLWSLWLGTISKCNLGPLHQVILPQCYNENKDIGGFVGRNMPRETFRPARPVYMIVHKRVRFVEAMVEVLVVWERQ
jgi:hypothetical protein